VVVSVAVSKLGYTQLIFLKASIEIDGAYRDELLMKELLPDTPSNAGKAHISQQDNTPACKSNSAELLCRETHDLLPNSPDLSPVDYRNRGLVQGRVYRRRG